MSTAMISNQSGLADGMDILVIDSGIGGLSVSQEILKARPDVNICYFADNEAYPYGVLEETELQSRLVAIVALMLRSVKPALIVVACNTASTSVLPALRETFNIPVVGVVPAIKPAAALTQTGAFALLATPATIKRTYIDDLISEYAPACQVLRIGSTELVHMAEAKLSGVDLVSSELRNIVMGPIDEFNIKAQENGSGLIDTLVLGCTHFPFLRAELSQISPNLNLVDTGAAIARRVHDLLSTSKSLGPAGQLTLYYSKETPISNQFRDSLTQIGFEIKKISSLSVKS